MSALLRTAVGLAVLAVCANAAAAPPDLRSSPDWARAPLAATFARPLPTLVPPANDEILDAHVIGKLPFGTALGTSGATASPDDPECGDNPLSVWYVYTAPVSVSLWLDAGSTTNLEVSVYKGAPGALEQIACDPSGGWLDFPVSAGVTYYIMVRTWGGSFDLYLEMFPPLPLTAVRATPAYERYPAATSTHLAWSEWPARGGRRWSLLVKPDGKARFRVNRAGTHAFAGGFDGTTLVYQEVRTRRGVRTSALRRYNVQTRKHSGLPRGVNSPQWEWKPSISGKWLLFGRQTPRASLVILRNLKTGRSIVLDRVTRRGDWNEPGGVSGNYAAWVRCTSSCFPFRYDIATGKKRRLQTDAFEPRAPALTADGTVYFLDSFDCGDEARLYRVSRRGIEVNVTELPSGRDAISAYTVANSNGSTTVYLDRVRCKTLASDIVKVVAP